MGPAFRFLLPMALVVGSMGCANIAGLDDYGRGLGTGGMGQGAATPGSGGGGGTLAGGGAGGMSAYAARVLADEPVAYWRFGESDCPSPPCTAAAEVGPNGTYGVAVSLGHPGAIAGDGDTSVLVVDSTSGHVSAGTTDVLALGDGPMSLELWIKPAPLVFDHDTELCDDGIIVSRQAATSCAGSAGPFPGYELLLNSDCAFELTIVDCDGGKIEAITDPETLSAEWQHLVTTSDGNTAIIYIDGQVAGAGFSSSPPSPDPEGSFLIGAHDDGQSRQLDAWLDEVAVWDRVLMPEELQAHHDIGTP